MSSYHITRRARTPTALVCVACVAAVLLVHSAVGAPPTNTIGGQHGGNNNQRHDGGNDNAGNNNNHRHDGGTNQIPNGGGNNQLFGASNHGNVNTEHDKPREPLGIFGNILNQLFSSLGNRRTNSANGGEQVPLVAVDTNGGPVIHIPGIFGLNTGHATHNDGQHRPLVAVAAGDRATRVQIPGLVDVDIGGPTRGPSSPSLVSVAVNDRGTRVRAPFVDVGVDQDSKTYFGPPPGTPFREQILT